MHATMTTLSAHDGFVPPIQPLNSLEIKLAYNEMTMGQNGSVLSRAEKSMLRERHGYCKECESVPIQLYNIKRPMFNPLWHSKEVRNVAGKCTNGVCFVCHPDKDPSRRHRKRHQQPRQNSNEDNVRRWTTGNTTFNKPIRLASEPILTVPDEHVGSSREIMRLGNTLPAREASDPVLAAPFVSLDSEESPAAASQPDTRVAAQQVAREQLQEREVHLLGAPPWRRPDHDDGRIATNLSPPSRPRSDLPNPAVVSARRTRNCFNGVYVPEAVQRPESPVGIAENNSAIAALSADLALDHALVRQPPARDTLRDEQLSETNHDSSLVPSFSASQSAASVSPSCSSSVDSSGASTSASSIPLTEVAHPPVSSSFQTSHSDPTTSISTLHTPLPEHQIQRIAEGIDSFVKDMDDTGSSEILCDVVLSPMREHRTTAAVQAHCLRVIWDLCQDNEPNKSAMMVAGAPEDIVKALTIHSQNALVLEKGYGAIWSLAVATNNLTILIRAGVCKQIVLGLQHFIATETLVRAAIGAMRTLSPQLEARDSFRTMRAAKLTAEAMAVHRNCVSVQRDGCAFLSNCAVDIEKQVVMVVPLEELNAIVQAIAHHRFEPSVMQGACFALKNYTHEQENCRTLRRCKDVEELMVHASTFDEVPGCVLDGGDILERLQLFKIMDESLEDQAFSSLSHIVDSEATTSRAPRSILDFMRNYDWSPRLISSGLQMFHRIVDETKNSPDPQIERIFAEDMHIEIIRICQGFKSNEEVCEGACILFCCLATNGVHIRELVGAGACQIIFKSLECGQVNAAIVQNALGALNLLSSNQECQNMVLERMSLITEAIAAHSGNESIEVSGMVIVSILDGYYR